LELSRLGRGKLVVPKSPEWNQLVDNGVVIQALNSRKTGDSFETVKRTISNNFIAYVGNALIIKVAVEYKKRIVEVLQSLFKRNDIGLKISSGQGVTKISNPFDFVRRHQDTFSRGTEYHLDR
jgi:hypothetical protein